MKIVVALSVVATVAVIAGAGLYAARDDSPPKRPPGACRDWVAAPDYRAEIAAVRGLVPRMKRAFAAPGLSIAVAADGQLVWSQGCGFADLRRRLPVTRATQFRIGSASKPFTATAVARLEQQGRLDVDSDVRDYVPAFPSSHPRVTLRQLGGHLGGIRHYAGGEIVNTRHYRSLADSLAVFVRDPLVADPGERFAYSSYGFNLLGRAVEAAARAPFPEALHQTVLAPLGMRSTRVGGTAAGGTRFYEVTGARRAVPAPRIDLSDRYPSGGLLSNAEDLVRLGIGITDPRFLGAGARALLFISQRTRGGEQTGYGFGFEVGESPFGAIAGHTGNVVGGTAFILVHPRTRVVVALTTNVGFVTAPTAPSLEGVPDPPQLAIPFIRHVLAQRR